VRVPLAAVPEHGDVPPLDRSEVGVVVVENLCHCLAFLLIDGLFLAIKRGQALRCY
jgi:hypothetical protein